LSNQHKLNTVKGLKWSSFGQVIKQGLNITIGIILSRLLSPNEFGLLGMITVVTGFMQLFTDFGFGAALIQKRNLDDKDLNSVFWFNLGLGLMLTIGLFLSGPMIARFYQSEIISELIRWVSFMFFIQSLSYVQLTIFKRELDFKTVFWIEFMGMLTSGFLAIWMSILGFGVYSLVAQLLMNQFVMVIGLWAFSNWKPSLQYSVHSIKSLLNYSLPLMGSSILGYFLGNLDKLLIGRFLGNQSLGIYTRAYSLMIFPVGQISGVISQVMFPSLAQIQDDRNRIKEIYLKMNRLISFITFPLMGLGFLLSEPFVLIILGEQWREMIPLFRIFTLVGALQSIGTLIGNIFMALGEMKIYFKLNLISGLVFILASLIGLQYGIKGVAIAYSIASLSLGLPQWYITGRLINLPLKQYLNSWKITAMISLLLVFSIHFLLSSFEIVLDIWKSTGITMIFLFLYLALQFLFNRKLYMELLYSIKSR
jgi:O-antigen/teichoic acid export membrane protein